MVRLYFPGGTFGKSYLPDSFVVAVLSEFVAASVKVTVAAGTAAPDGSVTVPTTMPVPPVWANTFPEFNVRIATANANAVK
jgi:hypothetical protein